MTSSAQQWTNLLLWPLCVVHNIPSMPPWNTSTIYAVRILDRFAFYGTLSVLALSLTNSPGMDGETALSFVSTLIGLLSLAPLLGGILADRVLGQERAVVVGAALQALGYALLVVRDSGSLYAGSVALIAGHGLFEPTLAAVLANRFPRLDSRRETAFIVFFLAIGAGALLGPLASETAMKNVGSEGSFALSATSMALAALVLLSRRRRSPQVQPVPEAMAEPPWRWSPLIIVLLVWILHSVVESSLRLSVSRFTVEHVDLTLEGQFARPISVIWLKTIEWVFQLLWAPLVLFALIAMRRRRIELSGSAKVGIGMVLTVLPCLLMVRALMLVASNSQVSLLWVLGVYLASALPGLFLVPIVMVLLSQLVPRRHLGTVFGFGFALSSVSRWGAGQLSGILSGLPQTIWYGGLGLLALLATGLWISQVRRLQAALQADTRAG